MVKITSSPTWGLKSGAAHSTYANRSLTATENSGSAGAPDSTSVSESSSGWPVWLWTVTDRESGYATHTSRVPSLQPVLDLGPDGGWGIAGRHDLDGKVGGHFQEAGRRLAFSQTASRDES